MNDNDQYEVLRDLSKTRRAKNRIHGAQMLRANKIDFESLNNGAHLRITQNHVIIDYWPGTGRWVVQSIDGEPVIPTTYRFGINALLKYIDTIMEF